MKQLQVWKSLIGVFGMVKTGNLMFVIGEGMIGAVLSPVAATFETQKALGELVLNTQIEIDSKKTSPN